MDNVKYSRITRAVVKMEFKKNPLFWFLLFRMPEECFMLVGDGEEAVNELLASA